ncbi:MAG: TIGR03960 family B12-binding radical SAM protein [Firmicutes bacterium]|nr:TIGR03960 family B12-binding radical SAM protein [Bacillota bacterium]
MDFEPLLARVQKPGRYTGGEPGSIMKTPGDVLLRYAFCFPDTYEIGMSNLAMKILYGLANTREDCWCERCFAPWTDMEALMREAGTPLWALESGDPLREFDVLGFTLQYEMSYTNVLNMLDLAGIPLRGTDRPGLAPLVIAGGPCACNPEPLAPFVDLFVLGEGEEVNNELFDLLAECKRESKSKNEFLRAASQIEGIYVPSFPSKAKKRVIRDLDACYFPENFVVPLLEVVHDRTVTELFRGCIRGCRFCQAGFLNRPVREKSPEAVDKQCRALCDATGYEEVSLCSLSTGDYTRLPALLDAMLDWAVPQKINVALPSLRIDDFPPEMMEKLAQVRRSGLTFAPEAGTQRLRDVINKNITEEQILATARNAFSGGWTSVKLYFMIGLPTETDEDVLGIAALAQKVVDEFYRNPDRPKGKGVQVSVSAASFVPKPFTPFQWEAMDSREEIRRKQALLRSAVRSKKIKLTCHDCETSLLEGVFARGGRRLADVIELAWRRGARFDGWDDQFQPSLWAECFAARGIDPSEYLRARTNDEMLPWEHLDYGVTKAFLWRERERAYAARTTPNCREGCAGCGVSGCTSSP